VLEERGARELGRALVHVLSCARPPFHHGRALQPSEHDFVHNGTRVRGVLCSIRDVNLCTSERGPHTLTGRRSRFRNDVPPTHFTDEGSPHPAGYGLTPSGNARCASSAARMSVVSSTFALWRTLAHRFAACTAILSSGAARARQTTEPRR
jgi:hypothetical protein